MRTLNIYPGNLRQHRAPAGSGISFHAAAALVILGAYLGYMLCLWQCAARHPQRIETETVLCSK